MPKRKEDEITEIVDNIVSKYCNILDKIENHKHEHENNDNDFPKKGENW